MRLRLSPGAQQLYVLARPPPPPLLYPLLTQGTPSPLYIVLNLSSPCHCLPQVGVKSASCVVLGVEKKTALQLQDPRTVRKVAMLDDHVCLAFSGQSGRHFPSPPVL